ncbi:helix-turn-helix domain-containing protein [Roseospira visakhapatnamensis]|uniref:Lambda repressor-like predicted transcriptional regulator n=1 Tax=Roseospira visakhapatnamensis TaxID=390880 RepID=A0A7W6RBC7_9PROT|nr:helix-turn-helix domain-containing protein [Roseospira visakhapatnamensis]MBB4265406.1 lambda repressor-like predicted transcriptional regulator [Roseospira visakhapatnamensis]
MSTHHRSNEVPKEPAARRAWILYQLRLRGLSFRQLARTVGVSGRALTDACVNPNIHLEPVIAEAIGMTAQDLWPERWCSETGRRLTQTRSPARHRMRSLSEHTAPAPGGQRQKERVA